MVDSLERGSTKASEQPPLNLADFSRLDEKLFNKRPQSDIPSDLNSISSPFPADKLARKDGQSETSQTAATKDAKDKQQSAENKKPSSLELTTPFKPSVLREGKEDRTEAVAMLKSRADGKIEISEKDFDKIGPIAAKVLRDAGVTKLTLTPGKDSDTYEAELKKPLEIPQNEAVDGTRKLKIGTTFKAEVIKNADGSMTLDKIEGLTAESKILFKYRDASVHKIQMRQTPDGKSEITSTGSWNGFSKDNTREKPAEIFEKAKMLFERMEKLKSAAQPEALRPTSFLEIPKLQK